MADDVTTKILEIQVDYDDALNKIAQYRVELDKIRDKQKEYKKQLKDGAITQEEYHKAMESSKQLMGTYNQAISQLTKQISNQIKIQKEQDGSLVQWRAQLSNLTAEYDRLSKADRESAKGLALKDKINEVTTALKGCEEATQRYYRNVGNYPKTMAGLGDQLDVLVVQLKEMRMAGQEGTEEFKNMEEKAERLRETLANASQDGSSSIKGMSESVSQLSMGFLAYTTILENAGVIGEDGKKTLSQMAVVISACSTAVGIYNALQKDSVLYTTALSLKTAILNTSLGRYIAARSATTAAEAAGTAATGAATTATTIFNAVLYANPLVWLVGIIMAAVAAVYALVKAFQWFTSGSEERKEALKQEAEQLDRLHELNEQAVKLAAARGASQEQQSIMTVNNLKLEMQKWEAHFEKLKEEYDEDDDEYKEALESKQKAQQAFQDSLESMLLDLTKLQTEQREYERKEALGEYEYKRTLIKEQAQQQLQMARILLQNNKINAQEYNKLKADIQALETRKLAEVDKAETEANKKAEDDRKKKAQDAAKAAADARKKREEEAQKAADELLKQMQSAEDAMLALIKDSLEQQRQTENASYERRLADLRKAQAKYTSQSEYDVKMRAAYNQQIEALTEQHNRKISELEWSRKEQEITTANEILQKKLDTIKEEGIESMNLRLGILDQQHELEMNQLQQRVEQGLLTEEQANSLRLSMEEKFQQDKAAIVDDWHQKEYEREQAALQAQIDQMQLAEDERQLRVIDGHQKSDEEYAQWRERGLAGLEEHERALLEAQELAAQQELEALQMRGQLSTQTTAEYEAEILAAKQKSAQAQANTNAAIVKNEQAKAQSMKAVTSSLTGLLDTLGENNKAFAKMSKIITLAQIAIDTGKALSAGISSASSMPFPANIAAIATTVATILANVATAISTVKSAKFAKGGKVNGPGTGTSDSIPAMLSNGEFVMTSRATQMFEPVLTAMNNIGRGVPMQVANSYREVESQEALTDSFEAAAREIKPVVSVVEITETQDRVKMIQNLDTY